MKYYKSIGFDALIEPVNAEIRPGLQRALILKVYDHKLKQNYVVPRVGSVVMLTIDGCYEAFDPNELIKELL